jgi:hypothetical protein
MTNKWLDQQGVPSIAKQWVSIELGSPRPCGLPLRAGYLPPFGSVSEWPCKGSSGESMTDGNRLVEPTLRTRGRLIAEGDRAAAREG